jgi:hypothetical protein
MSELKSILDAELFCNKCGTVSRVGGCEPDVDGDGSLGCLQADCGGFMKSDALTSPPASELERERAERDA